MDKKVKWDIVGNADSGVVPWSNVGMSEEFVKLYYEQGNTGCYKAGNRLPSLIDMSGKASVPYKRVLIRRRKEFELYKEVV